MHIVPIAIIVWFVMYLINKNKRGAIQHDSSASYAFGVWVVIFLVFATGIGLSNTLFLPVIALLIAVVVMQPALWGQYAIGRGWVRTAYFLGLTALWVNSRSRVGGGFFYGWLALQQHRGDPGRYEAGRAFLQDRQDALARQMDCGELLMQLILQRDQMEEERFYRRLLTVGCLSSGAPKALARYAFRLLAAHALARGDWENLIQAAPEWRKGHSLWLANYFLYRHDRLLYGEPLSGLDRFVERRKYKPPVWEAQLPSLNLSAEQAARLEEEAIRRFRSGPAVSGAPALPVAAHLGGEALRRQSWALGGHAAVPETLAQCWHQELDAPERLAFWQARARELGCRDADAALAGLRQSVDGWLAYAAARATGEAVAAVDIDRLFENLRFKTRAINNRLAQKNLMNGSVEFEEFLGLMDLFDQLAGDPVRQHQAYVIFEGAAWNWMADLWNERQEKWLAWFICARLYPYARSVDSPAAKEYGRLLGLADRI